MKTNQEKEGDSDSSCPEEGQNGGEFYVQEKALDIQRQRDLTYFVKISKAYPL